MFMREGELVLHMQMETVSTRYAQVLVDPANVAAARALGPIYAETRFGQTAMVFDGVGRDKLEPFGAVSTPTLSDLFVALMQRTPGAGERQ
jgi:ABC-2 type transport system ATP-binding protein